VARHFAEYINRVAYRGEGFVLVRGNKPRGPSRCIVGGLDKPSAFVEAILERFPLLPVDLAIARIPA
jgi:hypothetical protein